MQNTPHQNPVGFIWSIANKLLGPYRPPQYRRVMLPLIVLRRFDLVLAENKQKVLAEKKHLEDKGTGKIDVRGVQIPPSARESVHA